MPTLPFAGTVLVTWAEADAAAARSETSPAVINGRRPAFIVSSLSSWIRDALSGGRQRQRVSVDSTPARSPNPPLARTIRAALVSQKYGTSTGGAKTITVPQVPGNSGNLVGSQGHDRVRWHVERNRNVTLRVTFDSKRAHSGISAEKIIGSSADTGIMVMLTVSAAVLPTPARESKDGPRSDAGPRSPSRGRQERG